MAQAMMIGQGIPATAKDPAVNHKPCADGWHRCGVRLVWEESWSVTWKTLNQVVLSSYTWDMKIVKNLFMYGFYHTHGKALMAQAQPASTGSSTSFSAELLLWHMVPSLYWWTSFCWCSLGKEAAFALAQADTAEVRQQGMQWAAFLSE